MYTFVLRVTTKYGQKLVTLEKNITVEVVEKERSKPLASGQITFSLDIVKEEQDQVHNVYWILRRNTILSEGKTGCFEGLYKEISIG